MACSLWRGVGMLLGGPLDAGEFVPWPRHDKAPPARWASGALVRLPSKDFCPSVKSLLRPDTSPALTEPAHMALHAPFGKFQLTAAVRARAHEHFTAA